MYAPILRRWIPLALAGLGLLAARSALAAPTATPRFEVTHLRGTDECPCDVELAAAVGRILAADPPDAPPERVAAARIEVTYARNDADYVATLRSEPTGAERAIVSHAPTCTSMGDAIAASVAIYLDGLRDEAAAPPAVAPAPPAAPASSTPATKLPDPLEGLDLPGARDDEPADRVARNVIFGEILGAGVGDSINYERFIEGDFLSIRGGVGYAQPPSGSNMRGKILTFPVTFQLESSVTGSHNFHVAAGGTVVYREGNVNMDWYNPQNLGLSTTAPPSQAVIGLVDLAIGYRYLPRKAGPTFGIVGMALFNATWGTLWGGATAGVTF